jgi:hypothetical protein
MINGKRRFVRWIDEVQIKFRQITRSKHSFVNDSLAGERTNIWIPAVHFAKVSLFKYNLISITIANNYSFLCYENVKTWISRRNSYSLVSKASWDGETISFFERKKYWLISGTKSALNDPNTDFSTGTFLFPTTSNPLSINMSISNMIAINNYDNIY